MLRKLGTTGLLALLLILSACDGEGGDPPMVPADFPHSGVLNESSGGLPCLQCHPSQQHAAMGGTAGYHHYMENDAAAYATVTAALGSTADTSRNCLMCHVDHDLFSPVENPLSPGRAHNLRVSAAGATPTTSPATFTNTDFDGSQSEGGLCVSCHRFGQTKSYAQPDGTSITQIIDRNAFAAATDAHNYTVPSTFSSDSSAFQANCAKCHDDGRSKFFQDLGTAFSLHNSLYSSFLVPLSQTFSPADPPSTGAPNLVEERLCYNCHGNSGTYVSTSGPDTFGVKTAMPAKTRNIFAAMNDPSLTFGHRPSSYAGLHRPSGGNSTPTTPDDHQTASHAECTDCHNPHQARPGLAAATGNDIQNALLGVWGVEPSYATGNPVPSTFTVMSSSTKEYQVCFKCHSSYITGSDSIAREISPERTSYHPVLAAGANSSMPAGLLAPWTSSSTMTCSHCHGSSDTAADRPQGLHGSAHAHQLKGEYSAASAELCFSCHDDYTYALVGSSSGYALTHTNFRNASNLHFVDPAHRNNGCGVCHSVHGADNDHLIGLYDAVTNPGSMLDAITFDAPGSWQKSSCSTRGTGCHSESLGGTACLTCHAKASNSAMSGTSGYHHYMQNDNATYNSIINPLGDTTDTSRNCLLCHVDHNIFSPVINTLSPGRAHNLRVSAADPSPTTSPTTYTNTDFSGTQAEGGICVSCHRFSQTKAFTQADGTTTTLIIDRDSYAAASDAHNYTVPSTFSTDSSTFQGNCVKCHSDGRSQSFQAAGTAFSLHNSLYSSFLNPLGEAFTPIDPPTTVGPNLVEERQCKNCHGASTTYATTAGSGYFGVKTAIPATSLNIFAAMADSSLTYGHRPANYTNLHRPSGGNTSPTVPDDHQTASHAECVDCHNPHRARPGTIASTGNSIQNALLGVWGVEPSYSGGNPVPSSFTVMTQSTKEYQVCFKCHSSYISGSDTIAEEMSNQRSSYHPVLAAGTNTSMPAGLLSPWSSTSTMSCSHCHGSSDSAAGRPRGLHGSAHAHQLKGAYTTSSSALCFNCHDDYTYRRVGSSSGYTSSKTDFRKGSDNCHTNKGAHRNNGCAICHLVHGSSNSRLIGLYNATTNPTSRLTSITYASAGNWQKSSCGTRGAGCH